MQITLRHDIAKAVVTKSKCLDDTLNHWTLDRLKKGEMDANDSINISLIDIKKASLIQLQKVLTEVKASAKTISTVTTWIENVNNPHNAVVTSLPALEKMLNAAIKDAKPHWIMKTNPDGISVPYAVEEIKYKNASRDDSAYVTMSLASIRIENGSRWDDDNAITLKKSDSHITFYKEDVSKKGDSDDSSSSFIDISDEDEDDDEEVTKKPRKKAVKGDYTLSEILSKRGIMLLTNDSHKEYMEHMELYDTISKEIGIVYTAISKAYNIDDKEKNGYGRWASLNEEDKVCKLVVDSIKEKDTSSKVNFNNGNSVDVPIHPYIFTYNLTNYCYSCVHVSNIAKYEYDASIIDKLIISDKKKKLLSALIGTKNTFSDIISGKSGGIIILGSGEPGTGKTLTAEIYSELMKRPLYSIQSSQLGISVDDIESNLNRVLYRADKWNAVLLIDEADAYVYKRNNDILQNCIVGTFLRLLEYYNGVLFLTTNRADIIDDAIISRVTAHVKYELPTEEETHLLWGVLGDNFNYKISKKTVDALLKEYERMSGRDIRNLLKMLSKCNPKDKEVTVEMIQDIESFIPFLKPKSAK